MTHSSPLFATTRWTLVWQAAAREEPQSRSALEQLLTRYWMPLYAYARGRGVAREDAEDATQEFLSRVAAGELLEKADPARGKFRTYLLTAWRSFLIDLYRKQSAERRGGRIRFASINWAAGESHWQTQSLQLPGHAQEPDRAFMIAWAHGLVETCRQELRQEYEAKNKLALFEALAAYLTQPIDAQCYAELSNRLGISASALKVGVHRLRQRFGAKLRELVTETVDSPEDVESELSELLEHLQ